MNNFLIAEPQVQNSPIVQIEDEEDPDPDLFADNTPLSPSSDESNPALRHYTDMDSDFNPFSEESNSRHSARTSLKNSTHQYGNIQPGS